MICEATMEALWDTLAVKWRLVDLTLRMELSSQPDLRKGYGVRT